VHESALAQSGSSLRPTNSVAIGGKAAIPYGSLIKNAGKSTADLLKQCEPFLRRAERRVRKPNEKAADRGGVAH
jgi:hypothetical protein